MSQYDPNGKGQKNAQPPFASQSPYTGYTQGGFAPQGQPGAGPYAGYAQNPQNPYAGYVRQGQAYPQGAQQGAAYPQGTQAQQGQAYPQGTQPQTGAAYPQGAPSGAYPPAGYTAPGTPYASGPNPYVRQGGYTQPGNGYGGMNPGQGGYSYPQGQGTPYNQYPQGQGAYPGYGAGYPQGGQMNGYGPAGQGQSQNQKAAKTPGKKKPWRSLPMEPDILIVLVSALVLAVLFILGLSLQMSGIKWAFLGCAALFLAYIWVRPVLEGPHRTTATVLSGACILVTVLSMVLTPAADRTRETGNQEGSGSEAVAGAQTETTPSPEDEEGLGEWEDTSSVQVNVVTATPDTNGPTLDSLSSFFFFWTINDIDQMVNYCAPSWAKRYEDPRVELFGILANRIMHSYTPGLPSGTDNDISRTVPVTAVVDKNVNEGESIFIFNVIMLKENGSWYVDPMSLKSHEEVEATTFSVIITQPPTPQPADASMILYYNPDGGSYYHADPNCLSVDEKYRPLKGTFTYGQINEPAYANMKTCQRCAAPMRRN